MKRLVALYTVLMLGVGAALAYQQSAPGGTRMADEWIVLNEGLKVRARPDGVWTLALEWVKGPALLKFEAGDEEWFYAESDSSKARADGHLSSLLAAKSCLLSTAPVGALIGKIGGSSAGVTDGTLFVVGKFSLMEIDRPRGPIYLTINDELTGFGNNRGEITVKIFARPLAAAGAAEKPTPERPSADKPKDKP
jgi:hypothetical protein